MKNRIANIFTLGKNNLKFFDRIANRYNLDNKDRKDLINQINKSDLRYFKLKIPRLRPISELPVKNRDKVLNFIRCLEEDIYIDIKTMLVLTDVVNIQEDYIMYSIKVELIKTILSQINYNPEGYNPIAELYIECYSDKLTFLHQTHTEDGLGWTTPEIVTFELDELIVEKEITKEEYYQKVYDTTKYPKE